MFPRCLERQRGMVSLEYWGESLPESEKEKKELIRACSRLSDKREWHFPLSERLVQDRSWWANKMIKQKEFFYKGRTSASEPIFCLLVSSKPQALFLLKMPNKALLSTVRTLTFSRHVMSCHVMSCRDGGWWPVMMGVDIWWGVMLWILNTRRVHKTLQLTATIVWLYKYSFY